MRARPAHLRAFGSEAVCLLLCLLVSSCWFCEIASELMMEESSYLNEEASITNQQVIHVKVGALLEESAHEQANMFIRTIKMINERKDETIRQLLNLSSSNSNSGQTTGEQQQPKHNYPTVSTNRDNLKGLDSAMRENLLSSRKVVAKNISSFGSNRKELHVKLEPMIELLSDRESSYEADSKVCQLIESGVFAVVGPTDGSSIQHVQSICDNTEIPYFELRPFIGSSSSSSFTFSSSSSATSQPQPQPQTQQQQQQQQLLTGSSSPEAFASSVGYSPELLTTPTQKQQTHQHQPQLINKPEELTVNLFPPAQLLTSAYIELINAWNWSSFAIVYEDSSSMVKLQDLFRESSGTWTSKWQIKLFQFNPSPPLLHHSSSLFNTSYKSLAPSRGHSSDLNNPSDYLGQQQQKQRRSILNPEKRSTFRELFWQIRTTGEHNILLDVRTEHLYEALKQAQQVGCMTESYSYLITSLDLHTIELEDFKYSRTRITGFSMLHVAHESASTNKLVVNERYLERLGVLPSSHSLASELTASARTLKSSATGSGSGGIEQTSNGNGKQRVGGGGMQAAHRLKLSPSVVLERSGAFMEPPGDSYGADWARRESLQSSPASMGLLPSLDRDNEQRLFEFFLEQQERQQANKVRLSLASAVLHDSLLLYSLALRELDLPEGSLLGVARGEMGVAGATCGPNVAQPWSHGSTLVNYMRQISFTGLTGLVSFDQRGLRSDFQLNLLGMAPDLGLVKVGEWHSGRASGNRMIPVNRLDDENITLTTDDTQSAPDEPLGSLTYEQQSEYYDAQLRHFQQLALVKGDNKPVKIPYSKMLTKGGALQVNEIIYERLYREHSDQVDTLIVTTKLSQPYFMLKETPNKLEGNDQYEGFAVDLIHELSKLINFKYKWREVADKKYGSKEILANGTVIWNGMIGEIVRGQADLAIVDLTITAQREEAVDFTLPFMNTGISILFKKPTTKVTTLFSFLSPFSSDVWAYVLAAYCGISAVLYLVGHLSPYEWSNPHPCRHTSSGDSDDDVLILKNQFSLLNSFWFTIGSLMQQGSDLTPRSMSTRTIAGIWYFFTLIMISSYTANLAAFLTVEKVVYPIENVRDLSNQQEIKYGCVESGSTCTFFHDSQIDTYKRINENMQRFKTYVRSNDEGQKRVEEGKFAFFMESASIEYIVERNCNLTQIGGLLDSKGYGLATSKRSRLKRPYRTLLSEGILHLQETGMLHVLKNRWWKERRGGGTCTDDGKGGGVTELSLANVGGVFVVLLGGLGVSFLVAIAEFMWRSKRGGSTRDSMCEEMMNDLKFALSCKRSMKPVNQARRERTRQRNNQLAANNSNSNNNINTRRSKQRQQLWSSESLSSQVDLPPPPPTFNRQQGQQNNLKDCNPVLLHAMLTMLFEQQQQQQQQQQGEHQYRLTGDNDKQVSEFNSSTTASVANLAHAKLHYGSNSMREASEGTQSMAGNSNLGLSRTGLSGKKLLDSENLLTKVNGKMAKQGNGQVRVVGANTGELNWRFGATCEETGPISLSLSTPSISALNNSAAVVVERELKGGGGGGAGKRRLLFAQQTIDTDGDDNLFVSQQ